MKELRLKIQINKPAVEVFAFTLNPKNTPRWVSSIEIEKTNEWPPKLGTVYRNKGKHTDWSEYVMTKFELNNLFVLSQKGTSYHVQYTFTPLDDNSCELEYFEWLDEGELEAPFTINTMQKLKDIIEA